MHSKNLIFDSLNGTVFISGFDQSTHMNGISEGEIKFISSTQKVIFSDGNTIFSSANENGITVAGDNGIEIYTNVSSDSPAHLLFSFPNSDLIIGSAIEIVTNNANANIIFESTNTH